MMDIGKDLQNAYDDGYKQRASEIVRCMDCTYWLNAEENEKGFVICPASGMEITEDDYCSYAERRSECK